MGRTVMVQDFGTTMIRKNDRELELSVVIVMDQDQAKVRPCLDALSRQGLSPTRFEVILVRLCSARNSSILDPPTSTQYVVRLVEAPDGNVGRALNAASRLATGFYCLFLGEGIVPDPCMLAAHLEVQHRYNGAVGIGSILHLPTGATSGFAHYRIRKWNEREKQLEQRTRDATFLDASRINLSVPREALLEVGGFATDLPDCQDVELAYRLQRHGLSCIYVSEASGHLDYCRTPVEIVADATQSGVAAVELYQRHPEILPKLQLGQFTNTNLRLLLFRRFLLAVRMPTNILLVFGSVIRKPSWAPIWYHVLETYGYWRGVQQALADTEAWCALLHAPTILMYHAIGDRGTPGSRYVVPVKRFARQMALLRRSGYHVISLEELLQYRCRHSLPPGRSVIITFDDGYADNRTLALPILRRLGFPATVFLVTGSVSKVNGWDQSGDLAGRPLLSWKDAREMHHHGVQFGAHTRHHQSLTQIDGMRLVEETQGARDDIENGLGLSVRTFSYPNGHFNAKCQAAVERAGYLAACCSSAGVNEPSTPDHALRRVEIPGTMGLVSFAMAVWIGSRGGIVRLLGGR